MVGGDGRLADVFPMPNFEPVALQTVSATEPIEGTGKPRGAKVTFYAQRVKPE